MIRLPLLLSAMLAFGQMAQATPTVIQATGFSDNPAKYAEWLTLVGQTPQYVLDFESGYSDGERVSGDVGIGGLSIAGIGVGGGDPAIESGSGSIGGSNPIGSFALELPDDGAFAGQDVLVLSFSAPLAYLSFYVIDSGFRVVDFGAAGSFTSNATGSSGNSAEFRGVVFGTGDLVTEVRFPFTSDGTSGWGIDNIAWGTVPAVPMPGTLPLMLAGLGVLGATVARRRRSLTD